MLYDALSEYITFTFYEDIIDASHEIIYQHATSYDSVEIDPNNKEYILFHNKNLCEHRIKNTLDFDVTPLLFERDLICISAADKKINIFCKKNRWTVRISVFRMI